MANSSLPHKPRPASQHDKRKSSFRYNPSFARSPGKSDDFVPKQITLTDIFKHSNKVSSTDLPGTTKEQAKKALEAAGYAGSKISGIVDNNKDISIREMREVVKHLYKHDVYGFSQPHNIMVNKYLEKERLKKENIARLIQSRNIDRATERFADNNNKNKKHYGLSGSNSKPSSPKSAKPTSRRINLPF